MTALLRVDGKRLVRTIETLGGIGRGPDGLHRTAFSAADREGRAYVSSLMREAGLAVRVDPAGNMIGRRDSTGRGGALASGSHIDTVPGGGAFDGAYGVLAAIEVARALAEAGATLAHPLEVIAFADEEGSRVPGGLFGSRAMAGSLDPALAAAAAADASLASDARAAGGALDRLPHARRRPGEIAAYVELHVEQGPVLATRGVPIGVVTGVTGRALLEVEVTGAANHAGTTPMDARQDALVAAASIVLAVRALGGDDATCRTATVGMLAVEPGAANVVPGRALLSVDARDMEPARIERAETALRARAAEIARETGVAIAVARRSGVAPAPADPRLQQAVAGAARALGLATADLPSGAGHDAQAVAAIAPIGMIFVPSREGVSHAAAEYSTPEDCENGANVLLGALLALDTEVS